MKTNKSLYSLLSGAMILPFLCGCMSDKKVQPNHTVPAVIPVQAQIPSEITVTSKSIPGTPRAGNNNPTGGYAPTSVQTQFKIDV